jgi:hypothetical protein
MAVDTRDKRAAAVGINTRRILPYPSGSIKASQRRMLTGNYPFAASLPVFGPDQETAQAISVAWAAASMTSLVPGGLHKDRLVAPTATPYARLSVKQGDKKNVFCSGHRYIDYREVKIEIWGIGDIATGTIVPAVQAFLDDPNAPLVFSNPSVHFMRCEPLDVTCTEVDEIKAGQEYRAAVFRWCVWTDRLQPGH